MKFKKEKLLILAVCISSTNFPRKYKNAELMPTLPELRKNTALQTL